MLGNKVFVEMLFTVSFSPLSATCIVVIISTKLLAISTAYYENYTKCIGTLCM